MAQVLLFNITGEKRKKIRFLLLKLGIPLREVPAEDCGRRLGELAGREGFAPETAPEVPAEDAAPFREEMLVMDALEQRQFHALLDGLRRDRASVALKAVLTEHNVHWTAARLRRELAAENEALRRAAGKSVHSGGSR